MGGTLQDIRRSASGINQWLAQISRAMQANNMSEAVRLAGTALDLGYSHPALFNLRALGKRFSSQDEDAHADLMRAHSLNPRSPWTLADLADCLCALNRPEEALAAADSAVAIDHRYSKAWFQKGVAHQVLRQLDKAHSAFQTTVQLEVGHAEAHARLAHMAAEQNDFTTARGHAGSALAAAPRHPMAVLAMIAVDLGDGELDSAERRLIAFLSRQDVPPPMRAIAIAQLGDLRDAQDKTDEAFAAYSDARSVWAGFHAPQWRDGELGRDQVLHLAAVVGQASATGLHG
jgi:tetratricopeptide (TPR) repeat protein